MPLAPACPQDGSATDAGCTQSGHDWATGSTAVVRAGLPGSCRRSRQTPTQAGSGVGGCWLVVVVVDLDVVRAWLDVSVVGSAVSVDPGRSRPWSGKARSPRSAVSRSPTPSSDPISRSIDDVATVVSSLVGRARARQTRTRHTAYRMGWRLWSTTLRSARCPSAWAAIPSGSSAPRCSRCSASDRVWRSRWVALSPGSGGAGSVGTTTGVGSGVTGAGVGVTGAGATGAGYGNGRIRGMFGT